jgi:hypothetical protein
LWDCENTSDSDYKQHSASQQSFKPARIASKDLAKYIQPEVAKQFETTDGKVLRYVKETFAKPSMAKEWTKVAKSALASITKKSIPKTSQSVNLQVTFC